MKQNAEYVCFRPFYPKGNLKTLFVLKLELPPRGENFRGAMKASTNELSSCFSLQVSNSSDEPNGLFDFEFDRSSRSRASILDALPYL
jgi:hypothetical protein